MENTKIDWCDSTWNPVTGCLHGCSYCYAEKIAKRFGKNLPDFSDFASRNKGRHLLDNRIDSTPYPFGFEPTFHAYLLDKYAKKKGRNIFVCSMADLFGAWVPDDWKIEVLDACKRSPQHNYFFLTKDPSGYCIWPTKNYSNFRGTKAYTENMWLGVTYTGEEMQYGHYHDHEAGSGITEWSSFWYLWRMSDSMLPTKAHKFISIEPLTCDICKVEDEREGGRLLENFLLPKCDNKSFFEWIIVGAETGRRKDRGVPKREWVEKLLDLCRKADIPLFMKSSLADLWGEPLIQEFPKELMCKRN